MAEQEWQPIAEAEPEMKNILGFQATPGDWENRMAVCWYWSPLDGRRGCWVGHGGLMATHFQPLPAPPIPHTPA